MNRSNTLGIVAVVVAVVALVVATVALIADGGATEVPDTGVGGQADVGLDGGDGIEPTALVTPSVTTEDGDLVGDVRTFRLTAAQFEQQIAAFPIKTATVWGYNGSTPGPTLVATEGETVRIEVTNNLPPSVPPGPMASGPRPTNTTVHFHGLHQPNEDDGVAGISQPEPIAPGETFTYEFVPEHAGSFAYHSHTDGAVQELRGLDGMFIIQPRSVAAEDQVDVDVAMTLQQFAPVAGPMDPMVTNGALVQPFPPGTGDFPFSTINGKTGEASGGPILIDEGDRVRIRLYNASNLEHSMHLHGHDFAVTSQNGHPVPPQARSEETTQTMGPGDFFEIEFVADNPGNWIFHCHVPHHTANAKMSGYNGAPVGMTRIFSYRDYQPVPPEYFGYEGSPS
jgi:FtsP/CotA-like multicopper oxidase with cupredoxin domain